MAMVFILSVQSGLGMWFQGNSSEKVMKSPHNSLWGIVILLYNKIYLNKYKFKY
jgi:hypothetical protein